MSSFLCAGLDTISYNLDDVLSINPCDYVFVFEHFNIHHSDYLTCFCGTNRPDRYNTKTNMKNTNTSVNRCLVQKYSKRKYPKYPKHFRLA